jgi:hypothetical protein
MNNVYRVRIYIAQPRQVFTSELRLLKLFLRVSLQLFRQFAIKSLPTLQTELLAYNTRKGCFFLPSFVPTSFPLTLLTFPPSVCLFYAFTTSINSRMQSRKTMISRNLLSYVYRRLISFQSSILIE